jgi:UPF0716 protein FxsA
MLLLLGVLVWLGLEVWSLILAADWLGSGWMAAWATVVTSVIGVSLLGRAKNALDPASLMKSTLAGGNPIQALLNALLPAIAGLLMILPGFFGDVVGLLLLFPLTRPLLKGLAGLLLAFGLRRMMATGRLQGGMFMNGMGASFGGQAARTPPRPKGREDVVDADFRVLDRD